MPMTPGDPRQPIRVINSGAPIRICDNGGWTDTWFADHGKIFNIAVYPYAEVQIEVYPIGRSGGEPRVVINAENYGERYVAQPKADGEWRHPLLEAAIERMRVPEDLSVEVTIFCEAPAGASTGTSASVAVALVGALDRLTPGQLTPHEAAHEAHAIEVEMLNLQSGIQDQLAAAYGGINFIEMHHYPHASVSPIRVPDATWWELERRLALIFLGKGHNSSQVHEKVIRELEDSGPDCAKLEALRRTAERSRDAVFAGDFSALGRAMTDNTGYQAELHSDLVSPEARQVIDIAREHRALGWKVNGAGGEGGSITLLCGDRSAEKRAMLRDIEELNPRFRNIPIYLSRFGLRTWERDGQALFRQTNDAPATRVR
jgi:D-glycero-alpha-D-manno-heptose-7-phosphate kinase